MYSISCLLLVSSLTWLQAWAYPHRPRIRAIQGGPAFHNITDPAYRRLGEGKELLSLGPDTTVAPLNPENVFATSEIFESINGGPVENITDITLPVAPANAELTSRQSDDEDAQFDEIDWITDNGQNTIWAFYGASIEHELLGNVLDHFINQTKQVIAFHDGNADTPLKYGQQVIFEGNTFGGEYFSFEFNQGDYYSSDGNGFLTWGDCLYVIQTLKTWAYDENRNVIPSFSVGYKFDTALLGWGGMWKGTAVQGLGGKK